MKRLARYRSALIAAPSFRRAASHGRGEDVRLILAFERAAILTTLQIARIWHARVVSVRKPTLRRRARDSARAWCDRFRRRADVHERRAPPRQGSLAFQW